MFEVNKVYILGHRSKQNLYHHLNSAVIDCEWQASWAQRGEAKWSFLFFFFLQNNLCDPKMSNYHQVSSVGAKPFWSSDWLPKKSLSNNWAALHPCDLCLRDLVDLLVAGVNLKHTEPDDVTLSIALWIRGDKSQKSTFDGNGKGTMLIHRIHTEYMSYYTSYRTLTAL